MGNTKNIIDGLKSAGSGGWNAIKTIADFLYYLMHPGLIVQALWHYTVIYSFWICMFVALISAILYGLGFKKCAKYVPTSIAIYTLIKMLACAF